MARFSTWPALIASKVFWTRCRSRSVGGCSGWETSRRTAGGRASISAPSPGPALISLQRITNQRYPAFTDVAIWRGRLYLTYREATNHDSKNGKIHLLSSPDGTIWQQEAEFGGSGSLTDERIGHLSVSPSDD